MKLEQVLLRDTRSNQAGYLPLPNGVLYYVTDELVTEQWTGSAWVSYTDGSAGSDGTNTDLFEDATISTPIDELILVGPSFTLTPLGDTSGVVAQITQTDTIEFIIDGGGSAITTGIKGDLEIPFACTIIAVTTLADQSGSIVVDIWKDTYANYPPTVADTITASAKPTLSSAIKAQDTTLTGWTTGVTAGDTLRYNVDSASTVTRVAISLKVTR